MVPVSSWANASETKRRSRNTPKTTDLLSTIPPPGWKKLSAIAKVVWLFEVRTYYTIAMSAARLFGERRALLAWSAGVALRAHQTQALVIQWRGRWRNGLARFGGKRLPTGVKVFFPAGGK